MRRLIVFPCAGERLTGTLDEAPGKTGLLIVSGGNEVRIGAHRGMASLASRLAASGFPVFRYDRRGIGDSTGSNSGFLDSAPDMAAAAATFSAEAGIGRLVAFGMCDAATALALFHGVAGIDAMILANPWVVETRDGLPPAAAIRARYAERLRDPGTYLRVLRGGVDFRKLFKGLKKLHQCDPEDVPDLAARVRGALERTHNVTIVLAAGDATAIAFSDAMKGATLRAKVHEIDTASHSFARETDQAALEAIIRAVLVAP
jgi:exosortase A-associated hydrolase 1